MAVRFSLPEWERQKVGGGADELQEEEALEGLPLKHKWILVQPSMVREVIRVLAI